MALIDIAEAKEIQVDEFERIFLSYWEEIYLYLYRMLRDSHEAEDAAQETFLKLYSRPPAANSNYRAWLYKVASREGLNRIRSNNRRTKLISKIKSLWSNEFAPDTTDIVLANAESLEVKDILARMRPQYAQVLLLRHHGLSYDEISKVTGISKNSVGTILVRAEKQFVTLLERGEGR